MFRSTTESRTTPARVLVVGVCLASVLMSASACDRAKTESVTPATVTPATVTPLAMTSAQFQQLRWLEGDWHGSGGGVDAFFEGYRWVDDTTIQKFDFADSTFAVKKDSSTITLRGGTARTGTPTLSWVVVSIDSSQVTFAPERGATNGFEWRRTGTGAWTARLTWDSAGVPRERLYEMRAR